MSQKERLIHLLWQPSTLEGNLPMWPPFLNPPKKVFLTSSFWPKREYAGHSIERRANWFVLKIARMFPIPTSRNNSHYPHMKEIVWRISLCSKKAFLLPSVRPGTEYTWALIWKKNLLICFQNYQGIPYSNTGRVGRNVMWTLC